MSPNRDNLPRRALEFIVLVLLAAGIGTQIHAEVTIGDSFEEIFDAVWRRAHADFYDPAMAGVDWGEVRERYLPLARAAETPGELSVVVNRMLGELETSHTRFYTPDDTEYHELLELFSSGPLGEEIRALYPQGRITYPGIGAITRELPLPPGETGPEGEAGGEGETGRFVIGVLEGSPAEEAGLLVGDRILSAGGEPFRPVASFRGRVGKPVELEVQRRPPAEGPPEGAASSLPTSTLRLTVVPEEIHPGELYLEAMRRSARTVRVGAGGETDAGEGPGGGVTVGVVHVWSYAGEQYQDLLVELVTGDGELADADALVLDIRDGWGGASPEYLNLFHRRVPVLTQIPREGEPFTFDLHWRRPVVLLVNGGSRSGKEILAAGFRRHRIGPVVGERTAGAVTAGRPYLMPGRTLLFLAVADVRVDGERLEGVGVAPDITVPFDRRYAAGRDPQLEAAVEAAAAAARNAKSLTGRSPE